MLHEDRSGQLRGNEAIVEAAALVADLPITGMLVNRRAPENVSATTADLGSTRFEYVGDHVNPFVAIPESWTLGGTGETDDLIPLRDDLAPAAYLTRARAWLDRGATAVGGCCGARPAHVASIRDLVDS